jgi:hypothetical protein
MTAKSLGFLADSQNRIHAEHDEWGLELDRLKHLSMISSLSGSYRSNGNRPRTMGARRVALESQ